MRQLIRGLILLLLMGGSGRQAIAQTSLPDSLQPVAREVKARLQQRPSDQVRVVQVREMLSEQVRGGSVRAIPRLLAYLRHSTADTTVALRPYEEWALLTAAGDVYTLSEKLRRFGVAGSTPQQERRYQALPQDQLFDLAAQRVAQRQDTIRGIISKAHFLPEDSTFLHLFLELLVPLNSPDPTLSKTRQASVQAFLRQYPDSEYAYFVRQFAQPEYTTGRFSYGLDFHSGGGVLLGDLPTYFRHGANFGVGFEFGWDRYQLYLRDYIGMGRVRQPLEYRGNWREGLKVNYIVPEASVGYRLVDKPWLRLTPFVGVSALLIGPASSGKGDPDADLDLTFRNPFTAGLNLDVPLWKTQGPGEVGSWLLKLRAGVCQGPARHDANLKGGIIYLDLGIGGFGRRVRQRVP